MVINKTQKEILKKLIQKYENSATYQGNNRVQQKFAIKPIDVFSKYTSDFVDVEEKDDFNQSVYMLQREGLVTYTQKYDDVEKIYAVNTCFELYYRLTGQSSLRQKQTEEIQLYTSYLGKHKIIDAFCELELQKIEAMKSPLYDIDVAKNLLIILEFALTNTEDLLEREFSQKTLHNTKAFVQQNYNKRLCKVMREYGEIDGDDEEILEELHILKTPQYVYFKGHFSILFKNGKTIDYPNSFALSNETLKDIEFISIQDKKVVTIENLTSFYRFNDNNAFAIFLSGYHNTIREKFLKKIYACNPSSQWYHFGDIDPDGFHILENLKRKTQIPFVPMYMDLKTLRTYSEYKELNANDRKKAQSLMQNGLYVDVLEYMLNNNCKLEQEVISANLPDKVSVYEQK